MEQLTTKSIQIALKEAGLTENDLTKKTLLDIKTFKAKINTVNMQLAKGNTPKAALEDCQVLEESIIDSIVQLANDKEESNEEIVEVEEVVNIKTPVVKKEQTNTQTPNPQANTPVYKEHKLEKVGSGLRFWESWVD